MKTFYKLLVNNLFVSVINFTVWFAITFFSYLQTQSVLATSIISGLYLAFTALSGIWFGSLVDHHKKKNIMLVSSICSLVLYIIGFLIYLTVPFNSFSNLNNPILWTFVLVLMSGVLIGNIRGIALPTMVTFLIPEEQHAKANGLSGTVFGISFLVTSVISGLLVGHSGMYWVLILAIVVTLLAILHLYTIHVDEKGIAHLENQSKKADVRGTIKVIQNIPGMMTLIIFTTFNNFLGGVFMSLMDAYGLSLVSVQTWGLLWGFLSTGFIFGGIFIAKFGLGKNPLRAMFLANITIWVISSIFTVYESIFLLTAGMFIYLCVIPFIEAAEQTLVQKVVPQERQGRVFGFAHSVEQTASPLTAFLIGPLTQYFFIPFMTTGAGVELIGHWFGTGPSRGIALVFTTTGIIGLIVTILAMKSRFYKQLSDRYLNG